MEKPTRRKFIIEAAGKTAMTLGMMNASVLRASTPMRGTPYPQRKIRFSVVGLNHGHIYGQCETLIRSGGELVNFFATEDDLSKEFQRRYPSARRVRSEDAILEDRSTGLVVSASIPDERGPLGIRVMRHEKDFMVDKPGVVTLAQLDEVRKVQQETNRIYSIFYSERLDNRATVRAGELVRSGAIGKVIQTIGLGPHRANFKSRPDWFFDKKRFGGILCDIGSHQFEQFLYFTGSTEAEVVASRAGNVDHPQYPDFEDFGDVMLQGNGGNGYLRIDWFTPDGLKTWGDGRLTILGTDGYIEIRKYTDLAGREGGDHLFLVNGKGTEYIDCKDQPLPYGSHLINDLLDRTETAMTQTHCFLAMELALKAQAVATRPSLTR
jgi:predicted dehydrogenase